MTRAVGKHFQAIRQQRIRLDEYRQHEHDLDALWASEATTTMAMLMNTRTLNSGASIVARTFRPIYEKYLRELDNAERYLKIAMSIGSVVDVSETSVGHDIRLVGKPKHGAILGNQQRARDNLMAINFHDTTGKLLDGGIHVSKITIPTFEVLDPVAMGKLAFDFMHPSYPTVVLASFESASDATLYKLSA